MTNLSILSILFVLLFTACSKDSEEGAFYNFGNGDASGDVYNQITENPFIKVVDSAISTFSIDADGGSYLNSIRYLQEGNMPPADAIISEEFVNFFKYTPLVNFNGHPIAVNGEMGQCPWNTQNSIIMLKMSGKDFEKAALPASNFTFLVDVSGSMSSADKLPLIIKGLGYLVDNMKPTDKVSIVTYAGRNEIVLQPTACSDKQTIKNKLSSLTSGGGTNGADGIKTAYDLISKNFEKGANNRVILCSDGDFNIGISSQAELIKLIEQKRETGVYLTTVGVGHGNLNDANMEQIANNGNGNYEYIANEEDAEYIFNQNFKKFFTIAQDVKVQIEFNPNIVEEYRLIGYENRVLNASDFENDTKDAGDLSVNQTVIAMYEIVPNKSILNKKEPAFTFKVRYKNLGETSSNELLFELDNPNTAFQSTSADFQFASGVSAFAQRMRKGSFIGETDYKAIYTWIENAQLSAASSQKTQLLEMVNKAKSLD